jgi:outer membrane receptor for ferrienterochelin and colicins
MPLHPSKPRQPTPARPHARRHLSLAVSLCWGTTAAMAQATPDAAPAPPPAAAVQRVDVTGGRPGDLAERRESTASKIIIGRDEIERFGDSSLGDLMKRLPGVTLDGRAGRGGNIRMRGLGSGYTQILLDGERVQGGLSLDAIDPEMVERIEILRAPTAETGARAIAGTINIITREGFRKRLNDIKLGLGLEDGHLGESVSWTRDDKLDEALTYNLSVSLFGFERGDANQTLTQSATLDQTETAASTSQRHGVHANGRLQWRLGETDTLMLMPLLVATQGDGQAHSLLDLRSAPDPNTSTYASSQTASDSRFSLARLNGQWRHTLEQGARLEWQGGFGRSVNDSHSLRDELDTDGQTLRRIDDTSHSTERTGQLKGKLTALLAGDHSLVSGLEWEGARRDDQRVTLENGVAQLADFGADFAASTRRLAAYAQDEWQLDAHWAAHAGLRWESIRTQGQDSSGNDVVNRSAVWTPLLHALWKPEAKGRDQLRMSLTRSYRAPSLAHLLGRPTLSARYPATGDNTPTSPDRAGNALLKPELATGVDLAYEHYLPAGGLLSINLFHRRIHDLMRTVTTLETVNWSGVQRWVARPQNLGRASTQGIELEARGKLSDFWAEAPAVDIHANASLFRSRVDSVPGPDNRLDQQPSGTANLGGDYKLPGWPLTLGGNVNWTPGYTTRLSDTQWLVQGRKRVLDAYALWQLSPAARLRLSASNLAPLDAASASTVSGEMASTVAATWLNWRVQLELKL